MTRQIYAKPPITEAVVALMFVEPVDDKTLAKLKDKVERDYPNVRQLMQVEVETDGKKTSVRNVPQGYQLSDHDQLNHAIARPMEFLTSVLAPYPGWESFSARVQANMAVVRDVLGYRKLSRISARYINRLDVPSEAPVESLNYLTVGPAPRTDFLHKTDLYHVRTETMSPEGLKVIISSGSAQAPIIGHVSFILDIDVIDFHPPSKADELWEAMEQLHTVKNSVFELCITDKSRGLFQ